MNSDYRQIVAFLRGVGRRRWATSSAVALLKAAVIAVVAITLNHFVVDGRDGWLWAFYLIALAGTVAFYGSVAAAAVTMTKRPSLAASGKVVQDRCRNLRDDILTSLEVGPRVAGDTGAEFSVPLAKALLSTTRRDLDALRPSQFVSWRGVGSWMLRLTAVLLPIAVLVAAGGAVSPGPVRALVDPSVYWPLSQVRFDVSPGAARIVAGGDLGISVRLAGRRASSAVLAIEGRGADEGFTMDAVGGGHFRGVLSSVNAPLRYRVEAAGSASPWFAVSVVRPPRAGSFEGVFAYPAYTGLPERKRAFSGHLEVLPGTEVDLTFATTSSLREGRLFLGDTVYEVSPRSDGRYGASVVLAGEKSYRLELRDMEGFSDPDPPEYRIDYVADELPEVEIIQPLGERVLGVFMQIPVRFRSSDDFGLSGLALIHRTPSGREVREGVPLGGAGRTVEGEYLWDAGTVSAPAGSRVEVFLEASDNDTVGGPKSSRSNSFTLLVPDVEEEHRKADVLLEGLIEELIDTLADELDLLGRYEEQRAAAEEWQEFPWDEFSETERLRQSLEDQAPGLMDAAAALQQQMAADPLSQPEAFFQLERITRDLENMDFTSRQPRGEIAQSIDRENALPDEMQQKTQFMEQYTDEAVQALEQMILQAEEMQRERNMTDARESGAEMLGLQEEILAKLENLDQDDRQGMEDVMADLAALEKMMRELMDALNQENAMLPEEFLNSDALEELPLTDIMKGLNDIRRMLAAGDLEGAREAARKMLRDIGDLMNRLQQAGDDFRRQSRQALNRLKNSTMPEIERMIDEQKRILEETEALEELVQPPPRDEEQAPGGELSHMVPPGAKEDLEQLSDEEVALSEDAERLADEAAALKAALPFLDPAVEGDLRASSREMETAGDELAGSRPGGAVPAERTALSLLMKAREGARQSLQALQQMQGLREGKGGMGLFPRLGSGQGEGSSMRRGEETGGRTGVSVRSFRLPGKEDYSVPPLFRRDILESLKEGYPEGYEGRIKDYFHRITE